jgi:hypothetical protein
MTTKHHDGFAMYNTSARGAPGQDVYGVTGPDCPTQRDLYGEVALAMRERGLKVGAYVGIPTTFVTCSLEYPLSDTQRLCVCMCVRAGVCVCVCVCVCVFTYSSDGGAVVVVTLRYFSKADWHAESFWDPAFGFATDRNTNYDIATNASR